MRSFSSRRLSRYALWRIHSLRIQLSPLLSRVRKEGSQRKEGSGLHSPQFYPHNITKRGPIGLIVEEELRKLEYIRGEITLNQYIIMPNHLHCIIIINRAASRPPLMSVLLSRLSHSQTNPLTVKCGDLTLFFLFFLAKNIPHAMFLPE